VTKGLTTATRGPAKPFPYPSPVADVGLGAKSFFKSSRLVFVINCPLYLFDSFSGDQGATSSESQAFEYALDVLREVGLLPEPKLKQVVRSTLDSKVSANLLGLLQETLGSTKETQVDLPWFVERLKLLASGFRSESQHILVIDGLDELFARGKGNVQWDAMGGLLSEASRLNYMFHIKQTLAKVIVLCRPDMFERIPSANKNKIKQDCAVELNWYSNPREPDESPLVTLINRIGWKRLRVHVRHRCGRGGECLFFGCYFLKQLPHHGWSLRYDLCRWHLRHTARHFPLP